MNQIYTGSAVTVRTPAICYTVLSASAHSPLNRSECYGRKRQ
jgi:hypothetical protein